MDYLFFSVIIILVVVFIFAGGVAREKKNRRIYRECLIRDYGTPNSEPISADEIVNIGLYHEKNVAWNEDKFFVDDITWNDLSMDDVFTAMDTCSCILGEEQLYHRLHCPVLDRDDEEYKHFRFLEDHFRENENDRLALQEILHGIGINRKTSVTKIFAFVRNLKSESNTGHYIIILLMLVSIAMIFIFPGFGVLLFFAMMIVSVFTYLKKKKAIDPVVITFNYTAKMLNAVKLIRKLKIDALAEDVAGLEECSGPLMKIMRKSIWLSTGALSMDNPVTLLLEYLKMFFHIDLIIINHLIEFFKENVTQVEKMRKILGNIDASIAAGSYRLSLAKSCEPDFVDEGSACLEVKDCIHPLVENAVANSIKTDGPILLTGSNASGKSTFLKTVAISALMAQTLGYVPASYYRATRFEIFTSMALSDSILSGESYFMVEIRSLKRILDAKKDGKPVLCCIDEVLRGTNTVERIAASTHILKSLKGKAYIPFAATHDLELTHILEGEYANYHFDEEITDNDVRFNYMLREGRTGSRNAIKLLGLMEYDRNIVDDAGRMVDDFLSSGKWPQGEVRDAG